MKESIDLTGQKLGRLYVKEKQVIGRRAHYLCVCDCGVEKLIRGDSLNRNKKPTRSCGCKNHENLVTFKDIAGHRFGRLVALKPTEKRDVNNRSIVWECICDCGNIAEASLKQLSLGATRSCGCLQAESLRKQGKVIGALHAEKVRKAKEQKKSL